MRRGLRQRWLVCAGVVALVSIVTGNVAFASGGGTAPAAATLTGEELFGTPTITSAQCTLTGSSTFSYTVSGLATGPYPGLFNETGTVEMDGQTRGVVTAFDAEFTIVPDPGDPNPVFTRVEGTKTLAESLGSEADCSSQGPNETDRFSLFVSHRYSATIGRAGHQSCSDRGVGAIQMLILGGDEPFAEFREDFVSDFALTTGQAQCDDDHKDDDDDDDHDDGDEHED